MHNVDLTNTVEGIFLRELKNRFLCEVELNGTPVVCYAIGAGEHANHQITFFNQDIDYLQTIGTILNQEYGYIVSHCGYADADLFELTSFTLCRPKDLEAMTSEAVKNWVKENNIELASFKDLPKEWL